MRTKTGDHRNDYDTINIAIFVAVNVINLITINWERVTTNLSRFYIKSVGRDH